MNASWNPSGKILINFCSNDQYNSVSGLVELVRFGALLADRDATGSNLYGFEPFFKSTGYPVTTMLKDIADLKPLGMLTPKFACVNQRASDYFSRIQPSLLDLCQDPPTRESIVIKGYNNIFICPWTWSFENEPISPDPNNCPPVEGNRYIKGYRRYRSNVILSALVRWRLQNILVRLPAPRALNEMVALNAPESYISAQNYDAYVSSKCLW